MHRCTKTKRFRQLAVAQLYVNAIASLGPLSDCSRDGQLEWVDYLSSQFLTGHRALTLGVTGQVEDLWKLVDAEDHGRPSRLFLRWSAGWLVKS